MAGDDTTADESTEHRAGAADADPRCSGEYVRIIDGVARDTESFQSNESDGDGREDVKAPSGDVILVGVVHDHPASAHRARTVAAARDPDVLALELPPLAVPLFERYARRTADADEEETHGDESDAATPPTGGEMSAAIRAAETDHTAGIDGPTPGFAARLARTLVAERATRSTVRAAVGRFARASGHAIACRLAAVIAGRTDREPELSAPRSHEVTASDRPAEQARDERRQVRLARSVAAAFGADRAVATRDATREAHMADRLAELSKTGDVVAVLGVDHLDPVAARLEAGR